MKANGVKQGLAQSSARVAAARRALENGSPMELDELAQIVDSACSGLAELPGAQAKAFQPQLMALFDDLDGLTKAMWSEHEALKQLLGDLETRQRARSAYRKSIATGR